MDIGIGQPINLLDVVKKILNSWPAYQLAVQHGAGGPDTAAKDEWLAEEIALYLETNKEPVGDYSLIDWLDDVLDHEFNLYVEDDSIKVFSHLFIQAWTCFHANNAAGLKTLWNEIPGKTLANVKPKDGEEDSSDNDGSDGDNDDEPMDTDDAPTKSKKGPRFVEEDDGWTSVKR